MALGGRLSIIAEKINDSVPSSRELFEKGRTDEIINLAKEQAKEGGRYIDLNIGMRDPNLMEELVKGIQNSVSTPISIDTPSFEIAECALKAYDPEKANGEKPLLNSIALQRLEMFDLLKIQPAKVILMINEKESDGKAVMNSSAEDLLMAADQMYTVAKKFNIPDDDIIFDPSISPLATDIQGLTKMTVEGIKLIHNDEKLKGCHISVGLSNFTVSLPGKTKSGDPVKLPLENAFLTLTLPSGLDYVVGSTKKKYELLADDEPAMEVLRKVISLDDVTILSHVRKFYNR
jgi:5-methyltetrahydrofolate--homocysteine methyltransferase